MMLQATNFENQFPPPTTLRVVPVEPGAGSAREGVVEMYQSHFRSIARLAYLLCGDTHQADDLAHDAFVRLYERWDDVREADKRLAYLRSCVVNLAHSAHRRKATAARHQGAPHVLALAANGASAEEAAIGRAQRPEVLAALAELSTKQRTAVVLRYWLRMTETEIADAMNCSIGSVRTHIARGHTTLATRLGGLR
jgi:RNA polymerase sigma-70 factor (sigma-E family)